MQLAIPDDLVVEAPELCRMVASAARLHGWTVYCVVEHHRAEAHAALGNRAEYTAGAWLDGAVWLGRRYSAPASDSGATRATCL